MINWISLPFIFITAPLIINSHELGANTDCEGVTYYRWEAETLLRGGLVLGVQVETLDECKQRCIQASDASPCESFNFIGTEAPFTCEMHDVNHEGRDTISVYQQDSLYYYKTELCPEGNVMVTEGSGEEETSTANKNAENLMQDESKEDDRSQFVRWVDEKPEAVAMVGMTILVVLLVIVIIVIICVAYPRRHEEWNLKSSKV